MWFAVCAPLLFNAGDRVAGLVEELASSRRRKDQFGASVGRIEASFEVAETLEFVDQLRAGGEAEVGAVGEFGESDAVDAEVAPDLQMREAKTWEQFLALWFAEEFRAEAVHKPDEKLTDREAIIRNWGRG